MQTLRFRQALVAATCGLAVGIAGTSCGGNSREPTRATERPSLYANDYEDECPLPYDDRCRATNSTERTTIQNAINRIRPDDWGNTSMCNMFKAIAQANLDASTGNKATDKIGIWEYAILDYERDADHHFAEDVTHFLSGNEGDEYLLVHEAVHEFFGTEGEAEPEYWGTACTQY